MRLRPVDAEIARLAVPAFAALVCEPLFLLADAAIVGHLGVAPLAALGIAGTVVQTAVGVFVFLAYGTTATVARRLGADDRPAALAAGIDGIWLALGIGALVTAVTAGLARNIVTAFGAAPRVADLGVLYLRIAAFGIPSLLLMLAATGVVRGLQDTRTPLVVTVTANFANIGLNVALVYGLGLGIAGSAEGTVIAQTAGAAAMAAVVLRGAKRYDARLVPRWTGLVTTAREGVPLIVRTLTLRAALLLATYVAASISTPAVAAHQVAFTVWSFLAFALDAVAIAGQAITGRLLGAGDAAGARAAMRRMVWWGVVSGVVLGALLAVSRAMLAPLFSTDPTVQQLVTVVLLIVAVHQPVAGVVFVLDGVLIGAGDGRYLAGAGLVALAGFAPLALAVAWTGGGLPWLWWAFTGFMVFRMVTLVARARETAWLVLGPVRSNPAPS